MDDGFGGTDTLIDIEGVAGSNHDDLMIGNSDGNSLFGEAGDDDLFGGQGDDWLSGGDGADQLTGGEGLDRFIIYAGEGGIDEILDFGADSNLIYLRDFEGADFYLAESTPGSSNLMNGSDIVAYLPGVQFDSSSVDIFYDDGDAQHVVAMTLV
jgi:Ca2+-binding RTX toxin-like protein